jgi:H+-translocating NAD(P) transhydrogenase subunit beta
LIRHEQTIGDTDRGDNMPNEVAGSGQRGIGELSGRRQSMVALATIGCSSVGFVSLAGAFARYFSSASILTAKDSGERIGLYVAVFAGALLLAASAIVFFRLRNAMRDAVHAHISACPGCAVVDFAALLLCIWLGYGFVTEASPVIGLAVLLAAGGLAAALGVHLAMTVDDRYGLLHAVAGGRGQRSAHRSARSANARCGVPRRRETLFRVEWRADAMDMRPADDFTQRWTLTVASKRSRSGAPVAMQVATRGIARDRARRDHAQRYDHTRGHARAHNRSLAR